MKRIAVILPLLAPPLVACSDDDPATEDPCIVRAVEEGVLFVLATTLAFDASSLEAVGPECPSSTSGLVSVSGDALVRVRESGPVQIMNRGATSSLITLNDELLVTTEVPLSGCNALEALPLDNGDFFVTCGAEAQARRVTQSTSIPATDLSAFAGPDGIPDMAGAARIGDRIYVAIQRLESFVPTGNGQLVIVDAGSLAIVDADDTTPEVDPIELPCINPISRILAAGDTLFVACAGDFSGDGEGGIVAVDSGDNSATLVVSDAALGGYPNGLALAGSDPITLVAVPGSEPFSTEEMRAVRVSAGAPEILFDSPGFSLSGLAVSGATLFVGDRSADDSAGVYRIDLGTGDVEGPIATDVPPFSLGVR